MIDINLLPPERRPVERTPFPRLATIFLGVAVISAEVFFSLILFVFTIPQMKGELKVRKETFAAKQKDAKRADELEKRIKEIEERSKVMDSLGRKRQEWTPVLDHIADPSVLPEEVWLVSFEVESAADNPGKGKMSGFARGSAPTETIGRFIANMRNDEVIGKAFSKIDFQGVDVTPLTASTRDASVGPRPPPAVAASFDIGLETRPRASSGSSGKTPTRKKK